jgi:hypothetical protein
MGMDDFEIQPAPALVTHEPGMVTFHAGGNTSRKTASCAVQLGAWLFDRALKAKGIGMELVDLNSVSLPGGIVSTKVALTLAGELFRHAVEAVLEAGEWEAGTASGGRSDGFGLVRHQLRQKEGL